MLNIISMPTLIVPRINTPISIGRLIQQYYDGVDFKLNPSRIKAGCQVYGIRFNPIVIIAVQ